MRVARCVEGRLTDTGFVKRERAPWAAHAGARFVGPKPTRVTASGPGSVRGADAQVAAEGLDVDRAAAGAVFGLLRAAEIAAQVAAEAAGMHGGRGAGGQLQLHVAAHAVDAELAV